MDPAINGTLNVLRSCKKNPSLKRVVITSSSAAVRNRRDGIEPNIPLDESSWCNVDVDFCQRFKVCAKHQLTCMFDEKNYFLTFRFLKS